MLAHINIGASSESTVSILKLLNLFVKVETRYSWSSEVVTQTFWRKLLRTWQHKVFTAMSYRALLKQRVWSCSQRKPRTRHVWAVRLLLTQTASVSQYLVSDTVNAQKDCVSCLSLLCQSCVTCLHEEDWYQAQLWIPGCYWFTQTQPGPQKDWPTTLPLDPLPASLLPLKISHFEMNITAERTEEHDCTCFN